MVWVLFERNFKNNVAILVLFVSVMNKGAGLGPFVI